MLQAPSHLSKDYGHGHIKKFWLMQTLKESENKALLASSSSSFSRQGTSSAGKGHESKHSPQLSSGNTTARTLSAGTSSPSGLPVRPLLAGPGCFGSVTARHASLVTCAESLSPPLRSDHSRILSRPSSPNISASNLKEENDLLAEDADCSPFKSPPRGSDLSASSSRCGSPLVSSSDDTGLAGNAAYEHEPLKATIFYHGSVHDHSSSGKDSHQDDAFLQGSCDRVKCSDSTRSESHSLEACNTSDPGKGYNSDLGNFDSLASPLLPSRKGLLEKKVKHFDGKSSGRVWVWSAAVPLLSKRGLEKGEACRAEIPASKCDVSSEVRGNVMRICSLCGTSKTPLWRSGPQGPKSLCNACGIRFKKSKRCSGPSESPDRLVSPLASRDSTMVSSRPPKRKQETQFLSTEAHWPRDPGSEVVTAGVTSQQAKKSRWSKLMLKGEVVRHRGEVTGSSGESCLTWNLHSPSSVSLPSVKVFDKLATEEKHRSVNSVVGKDEEEAAALLMYLSCGLVYA